jgi:hypothetical protein
LFGPAARPFLCLEIGVAFTRGATSLRRRKASSSRAETAKKNSASAPPLSAPKLLTPTTRPQPSSSGPPELPRAIGAVWRTLSKSRMGRDPDRKPRLFTGGWAEKMSSIDRPCARSTFIG